MTSRDPFDEQLSQYLKGRANVSVPLDLMDTLPTARPHRARFGNGLFTLGGRVAAAASIAALVVGIAVVGNGFISGPAPLPPSGSPTAQTGGTGGTPSPASTDAQQFPATVIGLPVLSVAQTHQVIADRALASRAIAIGGWWSKSMRVVRCLAQPVYTPVIQSRCGPETSLSDSDAQVVHFSESGNSTPESFDPPADALRPRVVPETAGQGEPWASVTDVAVRQRPQRVVVIGHVGDPRAMLCAPESRQACDRELVVDAFAWVEGRSIGPFVDSGGPAPTLVAAQAIAAVERALPGSRLVTISPWTTEVYGDLDPRISDGESRFWFARAIAGDAGPDGTAPLTAAIVDDAGAEVGLLPLVPDPSSQLAVVHLRTSGEVAPGASVAIQRSGGSSGSDYLTTVQLGLKPATLEPGTSRIVFWTDPEQYQPPVPGAADCEQELSLDAGDVVTVSVTWTSENACRITTDG